MQISFYKKNPTEASITIKVEEGDYQDRVAKKLKNYSKKANIKGFRPGNVPTSIVQQMYGRSILVEEVNTLLSESLTKYLREHEITALGTPMPVLDKLEALDWENQRDFEFEYTIGVAGEFACELSKKIKVTEYQILSLPQQTIDDSVEQLCKTYGNIEVVQESTAQDVIHGVLHYPAQDFKEQTKIALEELTEKVQQTFIGLSPGAQVTFDAKELLKACKELPGVTEEEYEAMLSTGGKAEFTVEQIHRTLPAPLDQAFFDLVLGPGGAKSEQDFRVKLQERLLQRKQQEAQHHLEKTIQAALLKKAAIALPDDFLKRWLLERNDTVPETQIEASYQHYAQQLRWSLLVAKLAQEHDLQVEHEEVVVEVQQRFQDILGSSAASPQLQEENIAQLAQRFLEKDNGQNYQQIAESVQMRKLIDFVKGQITVTIQEVSVEEFDNLALE